MADRTRRELTAMEKAAVCQAARKLIDRGVSAAAAAERLDVSAPSLSRWLRKFEKEGLAGLEPRRKNAGRPARVNLSAAERQALTERMKLPAMTKAMAIRDLAKDPCCSAAVRAHIRECVATGRQFSCVLMRAANLTHQDKERAKGPKHGQYAKEARIRNGMEIMPDGTERAVEPGDWLEFDDMSENHPFWYEVTPDSRSRQGRAEKALKRHGALIGRQGLYAMDVKGKMLAVELIGRSNDAYTAADILRFMRRIFSEFGKPRRGVRLEQGVWKSNAIAGGFRLDDEERSKLEVGLHALGLEIDYCYFSGQKGGIEGSFDYLQRMASLGFRDRGWPDVGRSAGEREASERKLRQAHEGVKHPRELGFPHISELAQALGDLMEERNSEWHSGRIQQGVPDIEWRKSMRRDPLQRLEPEEERIFMPYVSRELTMDQEVVCHTIDGEEYRFNTTEALRLGLGKGAKVRLQFDPTEPSLGAVLHNATPRALCPPDIQPGDVLGWAPEQDVTAQFGEKYRKGPRVRRFKAFQSVYASSGALERRAGYAHEARDGRGNVARVEREQGDTPARDFRESEPAPAPVSERRNLAAEAAEAPAARKRDRDTEVAERATMMSDMMRRKRERMEAEAQKRTYSEV